MPPVRDPKTGRLMKGPTAVLDPLTEAEEDAEAAQIIGLEPGDTLAPLPPPDALPEPITFTDPDRPNRKMIGSRVVGVNERTGRMAVKPQPRIVFLNGHYIATKRSEVERIRAACRSCFEEPSLAERKDLRPFQVRLKGKVVFETYVREAFERFQATLDSHNR